MSGTLNTNACANRTDMKTEIPHSLTLTHGSCFSGACDGFTVAADSLGIATLWHCEADKWRREQLQKNYPTAIIYEDVRTMHEVPYVDIISAGFPCQDISIAGKMAGLSGNKSSLFYELTKLVSKVLPKYLVLENSPNIVNIGLYDVIASIAALGYDAQWGCIPLTSFGLPVKSTRWYCIASRMPPGREVIFQEPSKFEGILEKGRSKSDNLSTVIDRVRQSRAIKHSPTIFGL